jgi:glyoxylase-like metal-dependent hydrolase (beta-lactamase superfamily II)
MRELAPGVWQLAGLIPHIINTYLIADPAGDVLVDAGTRWATGLILRELRRRRMARVVLTHCHPDHQGAAAEVCRRFGVPLACHEADADVMEGKAPMVPRNWIVGLSNRVFSGPPYPVAQRWRGGETVAGFRVVPTPGHTPGHVALFREGDGVCLVGDVLRNLSYAWPVPRLLEPPHFFSVDPLLNRESIRTVRELRPRLLCFGHGPPLGDMGVLERYAARLGR